MLLYEVSCRNIKKEFGDTLQPKVGFVGTCYGHHRGYQELKRVFRHVLNAEERVFELMVHPGLNLSVNATNSFSTSDRAMELAILIIQKVKDLAARICKRPELKIISWKEIE